MLLLSRPFTMRDDRLYVLNAAELLDCIYSKLFGKQELLLTLRSYVLPPLNRCSSSIITNSYKLRQNALAAEPKPRDKPDLVE